MMSKPKKSEEEEEGPVYAPEGSAQLIKRNDVRHFP
jgi:hypothetical protein